MHGLFTKIVYEGILSRMLWESPEGRKKHDGRAAFSSFLGALHYQKREGAAERFKIRLGGREKARQDGYTGKEEL